MKKIMILVAVLMMSSYGHAQGPGKGSLEMRNVDIGGCMAKKVKVSWNLDSLMGEATVHTQYKWWAKDPSCKPHPSTVLWLSLTSPSAGFGYVRSAPVIPEGNGEASFDATGSPDWDEIICKIKGTKAVQCARPDIAKNLWKTGRVKDARFRSN